MEEKNNRKFRVAFLLLPALLLFFASISYALNGGEINANVRVVPSAATECFPNPFISGLREKALTCYIELSNFDTSKIKVKTLRLSLVEIPVTPIPVLPNSPNRIGDFDKNGVKDLKVTFDRPTIEKWFPNLFFVNYYNLKLQGEIDGVPDYIFTTTARLKVIKPTYAFVYFYGKKENVKTIQGVDLSKANIFSATIGKRDMQLIELGNSISLTRGEDIVGEVSGSLPVEILRNRYISLGFTASVSYKEGHCEVNPDLSVVCEGTGRFSKMGIPVGRSQEDVDVRLEIKNERANLIAKHEGTVVFELTGLSYVAKTKLPFLS